MAVKHFKKKYLIFVYLIDRNFVHDALYFATTFREMLRDLYRDNSLSKCSKTGQIKICVHYDHRNMATFKDTGNCEIYFGFGFRHFYDPVSPTLVAHEIGHALIKVTSNLEYSCQTGALAESFSDMCGVVFKAYINELNIDWSVGSEIKRDQGVKTGVRFMNDPPADMISIDCTRDYPWNVPCSRQDPHRYAGIFSKGFYNLVNMERWNIITAFEVFLRATKFYWQATVGFNDALCGVIEATIDIYGAKGADVAFDMANDVSEAFAKVGVVCGVAKGKRTDVAPDKLGKKTQMVKVKHRPGCPSTWLTLSNFTDENGHDITKCFKFIDAKATWAEAMTYCESIGAHLAVVDNRPLADWLYSHITNNTEYWIGGTDIASEGDWHWIPRDIPVTWTDWRKGQRDKGTKQNCLVIDRQSDTVIGWGDETCGETKPYICEKSCCGLQCRNDW